jgi:hypothetical protein
MLTLFKRSGRAHDRLLIAVSVLGGLALCSSALAAERVKAKEAPAKTVTEADEPEDMSRFEFVTSLDVTSRREVFGYGAITVAPLGTLQNSGFRVKLEGINGGYHYNTEGDPTFGQPLNLSMHGHFVGGSLLVGYQHITDTFEVAGYVGVDYQVNTETFNPANGLNFFNNLANGEPDFGLPGLTNPTIGTRVGIKFATEFDYHPSEEWSGVLAGNFSTANNSWWSRARPGYAVMKDVFVGPEFTYMGNNFYQQWRAGAHIRGLKIGLVEIDLGSGFLRDDVVGNGAYGTISTSVRF